MQRTYDGYGAIVTERVFVGGVLKDAWQQSHDSAGRRIQLMELNFPSLAYDYTYQADGGLVQINFNGSPSGYYSYSDWYFGFPDGRLAWRSFPRFWQSIARDNSFRVIDVLTRGSGSASTLPSVFMREGITWRGDSTQSTYSAARLGVAYENRSYLYDGRGHLVRESFTPQAGLAGTAVYDFDNNASGGLGLRTKVTLGNATSGSMTASYASFSQLTSVAMTGVLAGSLGASVSQSFDAAGKVTVRQGSQWTDTLSWDAFGRLVGVNRRNAANSGFNWTAVYDGWNRRLQTSQQTVTNGALSGTALILKSSYDPEVEFLELAVTSPAARYWKVYGPDLNGKYGGLQGTGGLEAVYNGTTGVTTSVINDCYGTAIGTLRQSGTNGSVVWNAVAGSGYGAAPGGAAAVAMDGTKDLASVIGWRGRYVDGTGYYYMGMRYYVPDTGTFLSADPLGHAACMDLYSYCNGDPVNGLDPDGRFGKQVRADVGYGIDTVNNSFYDIVGGGLSALGVVQNIAASGHLTLSSEGSDFGRLATSLEGYHNIAEKLGWYRNNDLTRAVQDTASMVGPLFLGEFVPPVARSLRAGLTSGSEAANSGERLVHMSTHAEDILASGKLGLPSNNYAGPASNANLSGWALTRRTGLSPSGNYGVVPIPVAGEAAFSKVTPVGLFTAWQRYAGQQYTARGVLDLSTGAFTRTGVNWNQAGIYAGDAAFSGLTIGAGVYLWNESQK